MNGGDRVAEVLRAQGVRFLFTLCGGHISPILVGAKLRGIRVIDVRHEATAVFAADAAGRLGGVPGVAAVTAGPGATNTITALKNAQLAESPLVLLVGAAPTVLRGRGALQDIDQAALLSPHVKRFYPVRRVREIVPALAEAFTLARSGVPGPVAVECPVDLLYDEALVRQWYGAKSDGKAGRSLAARAENLYLRAHVRRLFLGAGWSEPETPGEPSPPLPSEDTVARAAARLARAERPVLVVGSQALAEPLEAERLAEAIAGLGIPVYLSGMARGLLGQEHPLLYRHKRREALREADLVVLAGVPCDFRLDYGRHLRRSTFVIAAGRDRAALQRNRRPDLEVHGDAGRFLRMLAGRLAAGPGRSGRLTAWHTTLTARETAREAEIEAMAGEETAPGMNPVRLCRALEAAIAPDSTLVADGGDFVATASYIIGPRGPLRWLDPGAFGTLGVGAGFALGARLAHPEAETWILYGDGSLGYSLIEFDTYVRHRLPVIAVVGNDAAWTQIARDQVDLLHDDVGTALARTDYHRAAEGLGGRGLLLDDPARTAEVLAEAKVIARGGTPVLVNAILGRTSFRKGSISM